MKYEVRYEATYYVEADNEDDAIERAVDQHSQNPDGSWEAVRDPYESPLESLADGTYLVDGNNVYDAHKSRGYWVGIKPVEAVSDVPLGSYLGVWTDANGKRYYDMTEHILDRDTAITLGKTFDQLSIWDIQENKEIPLR